jgi:DNA-directed RNA polymerase subunit RPC12/RpoP
MRILIYIFMTRYICTSCNYRFEPKSGKGVPKVCPYCGKRESVIEEQGAQEILDEVSHIDDEE